MSKPRTTKKKRQDDEDEEMEDADERVLFFIPSAGINIEVLVLYLKKFLGHDSDAEPGRHPRNREVDGYFIRSRLGLSSVMVEDLKEDSSDWRAEKKNKRSRTAYSESDTAARRMETGASGQPTVPKKTQELRAARRAESSQPLGEGMSQPITTQQSSVRHQIQPDTKMQSGSYTSNFYPTDSNQRHQATYSGQQPAFPYASPTMGQNRPSPAINLNVNMNTASYTQNAPQRHQSPQQASVLSSIEDRSGYFTPAPPYEEGDSKRDNKPVPPSQPPTSGTHGFTNYPTAGSRHDRPAPGREFSR